MERILALRKKVDEIDEKILYFLKERVKVCKDIGAIKRKHGIPIRDHRREDEVTPTLRRKHLNWSLTHMKLKPFTKK